MSRYVVNNVGGLWGMQVAELKSGRIITASLAEHPPGEPGLLHGIGWTPDEREVWQAAAQAIRTSMYGVCAIRWPRSWWSGSA